MVTNLAPTVNTSSTTSIRFGLVTNAKGVAVKSFSLNESAELITTSAGQIYEGTIENVTLTGSPTEIVNALAEFLPGLAQNQAITLGRLEVDEKQKLRKSSDVEAMSDPTGFAARSLKFLSWGEISLLLVDVDGSERTIDENRELFFKVMPEFANAASIATYSSSSFIYDAAGTELKGAGGQHHYFLIEGDGGAVKKIYEERCWLMGLGGFKLGKPNEKTGVSSTIATFPIDTSVFSPERLVFEGCPIVKDGLTSERPAPTVFAGGVVDIAAIVELSAEDARTADAIKAEKKAKIRVRQTAEAHTHYKAIYPHASEVEASEEIAKRIAFVENGILTPDDEIFVENFGWVKCADISDIHMGGQTRDPQEPTYGNGRFVGKIYKNKNGWLVHSFACGKRIYHYQPIAVVVGDKVVNIDELTEAEKRPAIDKAAKRSMNSLMGTVEYDYRLTSGATDEYAGGIVTQIPDSEVTEYQGYAPRFVIPDGRLTLLLHGFLGAGKTEATIHSIAEYALNHQVVWNTPRNGLAHNTIARIQALYPAINVVFYQASVSEAKSDLFCGKPGIYVFAPQTYKEYSTGEQARFDGRKYDWSETVVILDEFSGMRKEILDSSHSLGEFQRMLVEAKMVVAADAFLSNFDYSLLTAYRQGVATKVYKQSHQKAPDKIKIVETYTKDGLVSMRNDGASLAIVQDWIESGITKFAIAADSLADLKIIKDFLADNHPKSIVSVTSSETITDNKSMLSSPDGHIDFHQIDVVMLSPTAQSGVDIQTSFDRGLVIAKGVLPPTQILQMMKRFRQCRDWTFIVPRKSMDHDMPFAPWRLNLDTIGDWTANAYNVYAALGIAKDAPTIQTTWATWQKVVSEVEQKYFREYLLHLLEQFFSSVETIDIDLDRGEEEPSYSQLYTYHREKVKDADAARTLNADAEHGATLLNAAKQPTTDQEVWDIKKAILSTKHPDRMGVIVSGFESDDIDKIAEAIALVRIYDSKRFFRLENYIKANEFKECQQARKERIQETPETNLNSKSLEAHNYTQLFLELNLEAALVHGVKKSEKIIPGVTHFCALSPVVKELYEQYKGSELPALFTTVETIYDFWAIVKKAMSYMGFEKSSGGTARLTTEDEHRNGKYAGGQQRYSKSKTFYHTGWLRHECSGNKTFKKHFETIMEDLRDKVRRDQAKYAKAKADRLAKETPPDNWDGLAA